MKIYINDQEVKILTHFETDNGHSYMVVYEKCENYVSREVLERFIDNMCYKMRILLEVKVDEFANSITHEMSKLALTEIGASSDGDVEFINDNLKTFTEVRFNEMIENDEIDEIIENIRFVND
jgi:hypothetical protein